MTEYDVLVIGAGPGGYVCAIRCAQLGMKTAIVDKQWLGGVCLNVGCIPSKALLKNAEIAHTLRERGKEFGFSFDNLVIDYAAAVKRSRQVSNRLVKGVDFLMRKNNITVHMGTAKLTARDTVAVTGQEGDVTEIKTKNVVIATGASVAIPPGWVMDGQKVVTYLEAILQEKLPNSAVIIGTGAIGVEFATMWNSYGVDVTLVEMLPRLVPLEDEEISKELARAFQKRKINILAGHKVQALEATDTGVRVQAVGEAGEKVIEAEQALVAIGFRPNGRGLGLEEVGVKLSERGAVEIDERMATNVPGIWAIGDVTAKLMLAHVGSAQGIVCAENIANVETMKLNYEMLPRTTFCQPQIASFGLSEAQAKERGYEIKVGRFNFQANGKALGMGDYAGWAKIITDAKYGEILGAHLIGPEVSELLPEITLAQAMELTTAEIARNVHAHPTLSEVLMEAAHDAEGTPYRCSMSHSHFAGVYAAAITPLGPDDTLDLEGIPLLLDFLAKRGCHGALLMGTTGEGPSFSPDERTAILQAALQVRQSHPDFHLLAGTGTPSLSETVALTKTAFDLGMDGVVVLPPYYYRKVTEAGLFAWFAQVLRQAVPEGGALFGYHIPPVTGIPLSLDLLSRLKDAFPARFAGLKDSSGEAVFSRQLGERFGRELVVFTGNDRLFSLALDNKASGCITAMANVISPLLRGVWDAFHNRQPVKDIQELLNAARDVMEHYPPAPPLLKALLASQYHMPSWAVRPPLVPISPDNLQQAAQQLREAVSQPLSDRR